jgi:16S rRNA pseudouridine516 synthase
MSDAPRPQRLDQLLSSLGYCSRREARFWVRDGRVTVAGEPLDHHGGLVVLYHKPADAVCTHDTREGRTVFDLLPPRWPLRNPPVTTVGRLDKDTTGLLLLTDIGALVQRLTSPRQKVPKLYEVTVERDLSPALIPLFASGNLLLEGERAPCLPATLDITGPRTATLELVEGRYHQVKRMFASQGWHVTKLHRSRFGEHTLDGLAEGQWRLLPVPEEFRH